MLTAMMGLLGQVGCVTLVLVLVALAAGLWLDSRFDTRPVFTLVLLLASVPFSILLMIRIVLGGSDRVMQAMERTRPGDEEDDGGGDSGENP